MVALGTCGACFGGVHGHLSATEQPIGIAGISRPTGNADRHTEVNRLLCNGQRLLESLQNLLRQGIGLLHVAAGEQNGKFIARQPGHHVVGIEPQAGQPSGYGFQHLVTEGITQHIVDQLETVHIQHHDCQRAYQRARWFGLIAVRQLPPGNGLMHGIPKPDPAGQPGQAVPKRQLANFSLLRPNADAHFVERNRQVADLIATVLVLHRGVVLALAELLRSRHQRAQRRGDAPRQQQAAQTKQQHAQARDPRQGQLRLAKRCQHFAVRAHQHGLQGGLAGHGIQRGELYLLADIELTGHLQLRQVFLVSTLFFILAADPLQQGSDALSGQGAAKHQRRGTCAAIGGRTQQRHMHAGKCPHVVHQGLTERETHQHPTHQHGCPHRSQNKLVRHIVQQGNLAPGRRTRQGRCNSGHQGLQRLRILSLADGCQLQLAVDQSGHRRADARAMVVQHRPDGGEVARSDSRAKAEISRQQGSGLAQLLGVLVQQAFPDLFVNLKFLRYLPKSVAFDVGLHHRKNGCLHHQQQHQR